MDSPDFKKFFGAVVEAAAFTGKHYPDQESINDGQPVPFDSVNIDIPQEILDELRKDALDFWKANARFIASNPAQAGHDFHLTRNHHGCGYWDGDWPKKLGQYLTKAAHAYGSCEIESGPDGVYLIH